MTEHVHKWELMPDKTSVFYLAGCNECGVVPKNPEIENMLNEYETLKAATERLSAEDVRAGLALGWVTGLRDKMKAYADTLEAK